ncbi:MAG: phosphate ABC transporter permease subunit PstC [Nocardioidaceae bacterium]
MASSAAERVARPPGRTGDRVFKGIATSAGVLILLVLAGVALFLTYEGFPAFTAAPGEIPGAGGITGYIWPLVFGTLLSSFLALVVAAPLAIGVALFISHYCPRRLVGPLGYLIDLLAAIPSVVYGLWGIFYLAPHLVPSYTWLAGHLGFLPFFSGPASVTGRTILTASLVLSVMVLPIVTALCREIFLQTPRLHEEAALALGATRWEMIRMTVFPYARSGMVSAVMLGLGRALGETMAVAMTLSATGVITVDLISSTNPSTIAANIALKFPDSTGIQVNALVASGLVLFAITFAVNFAARAIVGRRREFSGAN